MSNKNYYEILGVEKNATKDEIRKAYKVLAVKFHPDKQHGKSETEKATSEEKFKEVAEAYSILSDDEKRKEYDNPRSQSFNDFHNGGFGSSMDDILREMAGFGRQGRSVKKGQSIRLNLSLSLDEIYHGVIKKLRYKRMSKCTECNGCGSSDPSSITTCTHCGGSGQLYSQNGVMLQMITCNHCHGTGKLNPKPCKKCGGNGLVQEMNEVEVNIPKGVMDGMQLAMNGYGHMPLRCEGVNGDLLINISEVSNEKFIRDGNDLAIPIEIPVIDAVLGCETQVVSINGTKLSVKIPQGVDNGTQIRFQKHGMPIYGSNQYGNMIGVIKIKMPKKITEEEKELLKVIKEKENFK